MNQDRSRRGHIGDTLFAKSDAQLLLLRASLDKEMNRRGIAFSVGEMGERLAVDHFVTTPSLPNLQHAPKGTKNVDALSRGGDRFSIKTICKAKKTGTIYPDTTDPDKQLFEFLLIVRLDDNWMLESIHQLTWAHFVVVRSWDRRMNAWYVGISGRSLAGASVIFKAAHVAHG